MIRIILVALTVILYLIFSVPVLAMLRFRAKKDPVGVQEKSLSRIQGVFRFILKLLHTRYRDWRTYRQTGLFSMWGTTGATLTYWWAM